MNVNEVEAAGNTPLHNCAYIGWVQGAELLLSLGAKINASNNAGDTPWHWAKNMRQEEMMAFLEKVFSYSKFFTRSFHFTFLSDSFPSFFRFHFFGLGHQKQLPTEWRVQGERPRACPRPRSKSEGLFREGMLVASPKTSSKLRGVQEKARWRFWEGSKQAHSWNVVIGS